MQNFKTVTLTAVGLFIGFFSGCKGKDGRNGSNGSNATLPASPVLSSTNVAFTAAFNTWCSYIDTPFLVIGGPGGPAPTVTVTNNSNNPWTCIISGDAYTDASDDSGWCGNEAADSSTVNPPVVPAGNSANLSFSCLAGATSRETDPTAIAVGLNITCIDQVTGLSGTTYLHAAGSTTGCGF